jgi:hypothetical protein
MPKLEIGLTFKKDTKRTYVYQDVSGMLPISQLYIDKAPLGATPPDAIKVTVEYDE